MSSKVCYPLHHQATRNSAAIEPYGFVYRSRLEPVPKKAAWEGIEPSSPQDLRTDVRSVTSLHHQASEWINRQELLLLPLRVCSNWLRAMPVQHVRAPEQAQECTSPKKNCCDKQVSSWRHISCHTDKNRYYT